MSASTRVIVIFAGAAIALFALNWYFKILPQPFNAPIVPILLSVPQTANFDTSKTKPNTLPNAALSPPQRVGMAFQVARPQLPNGPVASFITDLIERADNKKAPDADAAYLAYLALNPCFINTRRDLINVEPTIESIKSCEGVSDTMLKRTFELLKNAAELGNANAQIEYAGGRTPMAQFRQDEMLAHAEEILEFKRDGLRYLNNAASTGNIGALMSLAWEYDEGDIVTKDSTRAYAYAHAVAITGLTPASTRALEHLGDKLTEGQLVAAQKMGNQIYLDCCTRK